MPYQILNLDEKLSQTGGAIAFAPEQRDFILSLFDVEQEKVVYANKKHVSAPLKPADAIKLVQERMISRIIDNPAILDEIRDRLENDAIVD
jgi:hypothetical protein